MEKQSYFAKNVREKHFGKLFRESGFLIFFSDYLNEFAEASDPIIVNQISGKLLQEFEVLTQCSKSKNEKILEEMHKLGIALWNVLVAKKTNKIVNSLASAKGITKSFTSKGS